MQHLNETTVIRWNPLTADKNTIYIGRPSKWGNPFVIGRDGNRDQVIEKYLLWFIAPEQKKLRDEALRELPGKKLACSCAPLHCHGNILAYFVDNNPTPQTLLSCCTDPDPKLLAG